MIVLHKPREQYAFLMKFINEHQLTDNQFTFIINCIHMINRCGKILNDRIKFKYMYDSETDSIVTDKDLKDTYSLDEEKYINTGEREYTEDLNKIMIMIYLQKSHYRLKYASYVYKYLIEEYPMRKQDVMTALEQDFKTMYINGYVNGDHGLVDQLYFLDQDMLEKYVNLIHNKYFNDEELTVMKENLKSYIKKILCDRVDEMFNVKKYEEDNPELDNDL